MKNNNFRLIDLLLLFFRDQILHGTVDEVSSYGLWLTTSSGEQIFIPRHDLELLRDLVDNFFCELIHISNFNI